MRNTFITIRSGSVSMTDGKYIGGNLNDKFTKKIISYLQCLVN